MHQKANLAGMIYLSPLVTSVVVRSKAVTRLLLIHCICFPSCVWSLFYKVVLLKVCLLKVSEYDQEMQQSHTTDQHHGTARKSQRAITVACHSEHNERKATSSFFPCYDDYKTSNDTKHCKTNNYLTLTPPPPNKTMN